MSKTTSIRLAFFPAVSIVSRSRLASSLYVSFGTGNSRSAAIPSIMYAQSFGILVLHCLQFCVKERFSCFPQRTVFFSYKSETQPSRYVKSILMSMLPFWDIIKILENNWLLVSIETILLLVWQTFVLLTVKPGVFTFFN